MDATLRRRVALLSFDFPEVCTALANALSQTSDVLLMLPRGLAERSDDLEPAVQLEPFRKPRLRRPASHIRMSASIIGALRRFQPDVVHLQDGHLWFNLMLPLLREWPLVVTMHDVVAHPGDRASMKTPQSILRIGYRQAAQVVVHAESLREPAASYHGIDPGRICVIPHIAIGSTRQGRWEQGDRRTVLFFGRIWPYKGLEHLIRAQPFISERVPDARFVIAGKGEDLARYQAMMPAGAPFTVIDEFVSVDRRAQLFAGAAVVVLPYVEASQSGVVPLASAFEKPVVATAVGGLPESVEHGSTGLIVAPSDHLALADAVVRLLREPAFARRLGVAAREKLERECSGAVVAEQTLRVYESAAGNHRRALPTRMGRRRARARRRTSRHTDDASHR
jgi:glycosyltransferase involved in cell wall biosynthesis